MKFSLSALAASLFANLPLLSSKGSFKTEITPLVYGPPPFEETVPTPSNPPVKETVPMPSNQPVYGPPPIDEAARGFLEKLPALLAIFLLVPAVFVVGAIIFFKKSKLQTKIKVIILCLSAAVVVAIIIMLCLLLL